MQNADTFSCIFVALATQANTNYKLFKNIYCTWFVTSVTRSVPIKQSCFCVWLRRMSHSYIQHGGIAPHILHLHTKCKLINSFTLTGEEPPAPTGLCHCKSCSRPIHLGFVVDKVALGQVSPQVLQFSPLSFIPPTLHAHIHQSPLLYYITLAADSVVTQCTLWSPTGDTAGPYCNENSLSCCLDLNTSDQPTVTVLSCHHSCQLWQFIQEQFKTEAINCNTSRSVEIISFSIAINSAIYIYIYMVDAIQCVRNT